MERIIKQVAAVSFPRHLRYVAHLNVHRVSYFVTYFIVFLLSGYGVWFSILALIPPLIIVLLISNRNKTYLYDIRVSDNQVRLKYVDQKMTKHEVSYLLGEFKSGLFVYQRSISPASIRFFSGKFRTEEVLIQPVTKHWPLSELERVHAEIMAVVPPVGQGGGMK